MARIQFLFDSPARCSGLNDRLRGPIPGQMAQKWWGVLWRQNTTVAVAGDEKSRALAPKPIHGALFRSRLAYDDGVGLERLRNPDSSPITAHSFQLNGSSSHLPRRRVESMKSCWPMDGIQFKFQGDNGCANQLC